MSLSFTLGQRFEAFIQAQLASGRYNDASDVVRDALRLLEDRERVLAAADAAIARGIADVRDGGSVPPGVAAPNRSVVRYGVQA